MLLINVIRELITETCTIKGLVHSLMNVSSKKNFLSHVTVPSRGWELGQHPVECVLSNCTMGIFLFPNTARRWSDNDTDTILRCSLIDAHAYWLDDDEVKTFSRPIVRSTQFGFRVTNLLIFYVGFAPVSDELLVYTWCHGSHIDVEELKHFSPFGTELHFHVNYLN